MAYPDTPNSAWEEVYGSYIVKPEGKCVYLKSERTGWNGYFYFTITTFKPSCGGETLKNIDGFKCCPYCTKEIEVKDD